MKYSAYFLLTLFLLAQSIKATAQSKFNHDYSQTLVMKLLISIPDQKGGTVVHNDFEDALELFKKVDQLTLGVPKIVYLVGWQYNGHDDKYPAFFEVNQALKREQDIDARTSLLWLMEEAKKHNTVVSLHINMTDAYADSPLWDTYVENDMISKTPSGQLMVIGNYNNRKAYQINYKNEWNKGFAQYRIDKLIKLLPSLKEAGTIHLDAWIARDSKGHYESAVMESEYQKKVLNYWKDKGIDVTSEWVMDYMAGLVPFAWHFNHLDQEGYLNIPAHVYTGSGLNRDVKNTDFGLGFLFGESIYGEPLFPSLRKRPGDQTWERAFVDRFYANCLQYFFLNRLERVKVSGEGNERVSYFSKNVQVSLADSTVVEGDRVWRHGRFVSFPVVWKSEPSMAVYSKESVERAVRIPLSWGPIKRVKLYKVTSKGPEFIKSLRLKNRQFNYTWSAGTAYVIHPLSN